MKYTAYYYVSYGKMNNSKNRECVVDISYHKPKKEDIDQCIKLEISASECLSIEHIHLLGYDREDDEAIANGIIPYSFSDPLVGYNITNKEHVHASLNKLVRLRFSDGVRKDVTTRLIAAYDEIYNEYKNKQACQAITANISSSGCVPLEVT